MSLVDDVRAALERQRDIQKDLQTVNEMWPGAPIVCAEYFTRGCVFERRKSTEMICKLVELIGYCRGPFLYSGTGEPISDKAALDVIMLESEATIADLKKDLGIE